MDSTMPRPRINFFDRVRRCRICGHVTDDFSPRETRCRPCNNERNREIRAAKKTQPPVSLGVNRVLWSVFFEDNVRLMDRRERLTFLLHLLQRIA
jgi:hypothetical protein